MPAKYNTSEVKEAIQRQCYFEFPLRITPEDLDRLVKNFFAFIALPDSEKSKFAIDIKQDERDRGTDLGWRRRSVDSGFGYDNKEFFHYNSQARDLFAQLAAQTPVAQALIASLDPVYEVAFDAMKDMVRSLDGCYPGLYDKFFPESGQPSHVIRLLKYDRTRDGEFLAKGHYDRGSCTIAIAESAPGLRIGLDDQHLTEVIHRPSQGLFFPGISLGNYTKQELLPSWHDVVQKGDAAYSDDTSRWAIVFFCSPNDPNYFDRETVHTPIRRTNDVM